MISQVIVIVRWNLIYPGRYAQKIKAMQAIGDRWERRRLEIWQKYSMPSLVNQTCRDFRVFMICEPSKHAENARLADTLTDPRFEIVADWPAALRLLIAAGDANDNLMFARMDSDDIYHKELIGEFLEAVPMAERKSKRYIQALKGYGLHVDSGRLFHWNNPSPPFFCTMRRRRELVKDLPGGRGVANHTFVRRRAYPLNIRQLFIVTLNGANICNSLSVSWLGDEITGEHANYIRAEFELRK